MTKQEIKAVLWSILIGATISFLTTLFQGILDYLIHLDPQSMGIVAGMTYYLKSWRINPTV